MGRHPNSSEWHTHRGSPLSEAVGDLTTVTQIIENSEPLHRVLSEARLDEIAAECRSPDFLGYLGLALFYTQRLEQQTRLLTRSWSPQLLKMVHEDSPAAGFLRECTTAEHAVLNWTDMERVEMAIEPPYRRH